MFRIIKAKSVSFAWKLFLAIFIVLIIPILIYADSWPASPFPPSHQTLYADTITSKTDASAAIKLK